MGRGWWTQRDVRHELRIIGSDVRQRPRPRISAVVGVPDPHSPLPMTLHMHSRRGLSGLAANPRVFLHLIAIAVVLRVLSRVQPRVRAARSARRAHCPRSLSTSTNHVVIMSSMSLSVMYERRVSLADDRFAVGGEAAGLFSEKPDLKSEPQKSARFELLARGSLLKMSGPSKLGEGKGFANAYVSASGGACGPLSCSRLSWACTAALLIACSPSVPVGSLGAASLGGAREAQPA
jgi:hypothetical protein